MHSKSEPRAFAQTSPEIPTAGGDALGSCCFVMVFLSEHLKGFPPSGKKKNQTKPNNKTSPPSICFSQQKCRSYRDGPSPGRGRLGDGEEGAKRGRGCWQPLRCFAGTSLTPVINDCLGERKAWLRSQHPPLPRTAPAPSAHAPGFARVAQPRQTSSDLKLTVPSKGGKSQKRDPAPSPHAPPPTTRPARWAAARR